jgi:hypothetical protein
MVFQHATVHARKMTLVRQPASCIYDVHEDGKVVLDVCPKRDTTALWRNDVRRRYEDLDRMVDCYTDVSGWY